MEELKYIVSELAERDTTGHEEALERAARILEDLLERIDGGVE